MRKVIKVNDLIGTELEVNVTSAIEEQLNILDDNYGAKRNIDADLGGYVLILETKEDVIEAKESMLKDIIPEYINDIECEGGKQYDLSLFLLSSDYAIVVVATKDLMNILISD
ncbi:hypothetical protein [Clostridium perfringens]|uniref:hypothetical protein n=1 Tax=Clostridium perfringens TaxID=1502 RepID=UPI0024BCEDFA|nr:hypothetical protein [Clostridium perfringens]